MCIIVSPTRRMAGEILIVRLNAVSGSPIFFQLVVKGLEADAQDLCCFRLIVVRGFQGLHNQTAFGLIDGGAYLDLNNISWALRQMFGRSAAKSWGEMFRFQITIAT